MRQANHTKRGFTLIEMVVAIALFIVVALVATVALLQVVNANKKAQSLKTVVNNLNYALESMTRELRVGTHYNCFSGARRPTTLNDTTAGCDRTGQWTIAFHSSKVDTDDDPPYEKCNLIFVYYFNGYSLYKGEQTDCGNSYTSYPIIYGSAYANDPRLDETAIKFEAQGSYVKVVTEGVQPYIRFRFKGSAGSKEKLKSVFDIQTTVSQRLPQL